jgi:hypothetical protein
LGDAAWRGKILRDATDMTDDELKGHVCAGLNYPPSQYQLHVQFILPPLLPFHYHLYQRGTHFTHKRFFPVEYVTGNAAKIH